MTKERISKNLTKVRDQLAVLQERQRELEGELRQAEDAEKMKFIEKNKITMDRLILLNRVSEEEILELLKRKGQDGQACGKEKKEDSDYERKKETAL